MGLWQLIKAEATTNLVTNPSFETNTTGWIAGGTTNTIARDTTTAKFGVVSLKCTYQDSTDCGAYSTSSATFPTSSATYVVSGWVYVPSDWDGGNIKLSPSTLTGAVETVNHQYTDGTSSTNAWVYMETSIAIAADVTGFITARISSAPTAGKFFYIDGIQIEEKSYVTTYCDGDQDGCEWSAGAHTSVSSRDAKAYQGGRIRVLDDDFSVHINGTVGIGAPQLDTNISELGLSSGGEFQSSRYRTRNWQLLCQIDGSSLANLHALKRAFIKELEPRRLGSVTRRGTPVRFRYTGGVDDVWIDAYYTGGAEFNGRNGFSEIMPLRLSSPEPFFRTIGDAAKVLDSEDTATFSYIAMRDDSAQWQNMSNPTVSAVATVYDLATGPDGTLYIVGPFTNWDGTTSADYLTTYDPVANTYSSITVGGACNNSIFGVTVASNGTLYVGGDFTAIGGVAATRVASYDGTSWSLLGTGANGRVRVVRQGPDGNIYIGGDFTTAGGVTCRGVAYWDGSAWNAVGPPSSGGQVNDLGWDKTGNLIVVGAFTNWNGNADADYIAKWDGSAWDDMSATLFNGDIQAIKFDAAGNFYIGGNFATFGSEDYNGLAYYNGTTFEPLSTGVSGGSAVVRSLEIDDEGALWLSGSFTSAGSSGLSDRIATWNGSSFEHLDIDLPGSPIAYALHSNRKRMYIGFDTTGSATYSGSETVTNEGSTLAYPTLYLTRVGGTAATLQYVQNVTTGARLLFNYEMLDGETLTIDLRPGRRRMFSSVFGEGWKILPTSDIADFSLKPGDNVINVYKRTTGSPTIVAWAVWQQTQLGVD